jgi:hypothetical protein
MATNPYFTTHSAAITNEQLLLEDLVAEVVAIHGIDVYYVPRESEALLNNIIGEQPDTRLTDAYPIEVYLVNFDGYDGPNEVMTKLGLEIQSSTNFIMTARSFRRHVTPHSGFKEPREGDLIFVPVLQRLFEIKHADQNISFHQLGRKAGKTMYWEIRAEQFKYSQENIETGIADIDAIETLNSYIIQLNLARNGTGNYIIGEEVYQGLNYLVANTTAKVVDWNPVDKVLSVTDIRGEFEAGDVSGVNSGVTYELQDYDPLQDNVPDDISDNMDLKDEALLMIVDTETNPLGNTSQPSIVTGFLVADEGAQFLTDDDGNIMIPDP